MTNREKYRDEIIDVVINKGISNIAFSLKDGLRNCQGLNCDDCLFNENEAYCGSYFKKWLEQEYKPTEEEKLESEEDMEEYRSCDNCKHEEHEMNEYPCKYCNKNAGTEDNWNTDKPKNYIKEFMKDNDLELGEEFEVDGEEGWFMDNYFLHVKGQYENRCRELLISLLSGKLKPIKLEPKVDWGKVEKGTLIEVTNDKINYPLCRYTFYGKFENKIVARDDNGDLYIWKYARIIK